MLRDERALRVEEIRLPEDGEPCSLASLEIGRIEGALVLALKDPESDTFAFKPPPDAPVRPGATIVVMADPNGRQQLDEQVSRKLGRTAGNSTALNQD